jgi:tetratricopeptide (TPR) repeat protein
MDLRSLSEELPGLIIEKKYNEAETRLLEAYREGSERDDDGALQLILPLLVHLYCSVEPPNLTKAEAFSAERERLNPTAYNSFQTAMMLYYAAHDYRRAAAKLREAIKKGREENDSTTTYSSLSLLGLAYLELDQIPDAVEVLKELERMVLEGKPFVAGDETLFLERMRSKGLEVQSVGQIASAVVSSCRDPEFASRLRALSTGISGTSVTRLR